ncbi:MAG TPA: hypothetical protein VKI20_04065, partial [Acidimicrobiales bacterium]|nr:hypothetical protein [Acidimicrobiales bacterium]
MQRVHLDRHGAHEVTQGAVGVAPPVGEGLPAGVHTPVGVPPLVEVAVEGGRRVAVPEGAEPGDHHDGLARRAGAAGELVQVLPCGDDGEPQIDTP